MGLGPIEGGDQLMKPNTMGPADAPAPDPNQQGGAGKPKQPATNDEDDEGEEENGKTYRKKVQKTVNGERVAFRPIRTKLQSRAKLRNTMGTALALKIAEDLKRHLEQTTKKFVSTKEQDEAVYKEFSEYTGQAEKDIIETVKTLNAEQKKQVLGNLPAAIEKGIDPTKLFDLDHWIGITTDALAPIMENLFVHEGKLAAAEIGQPELNPFNDTAKAELHASISRMSESYNTTTLNALESKINDGLAQGDSLADISKTVQEIYEWSDSSRADRVAKTEAFRTSNMALKTTWKQSGVVKTIKWYTANNPCEFCQAMEGKVISIDDVFVKNGDSVTAGEGDNAKILSVDYGDVGTPPLHPNCLCMSRPEDIEI
jgi:hypothetical protein